MSLSRTTNQTFARALIAAMLFTPAFATAQEASDAAAPEAATAQAESLPAEAAEPTEPTDAGGEPVDLTEQADAPTPPVVVPLTDVADPANIANPGDAAKPASKPGAAVIEKGLDRDGRIAMMVNTSQVVSTKLPYKTISIANPEIADFNRVDDSVILVTAKKPGTTQLTMWDVKGRSQTVGVMVASDVESLQAQLDKIFPGAGIKAANVNGTVALRGRVRYVDVETEAVEL